MGEITARLTSAKQRGDALRWPSETHFKMIHLVYVLVAAILMLGYTVGRNVLTKIEGEAVFVRKDLYERDQQFIKGELGSVGSKLNRMEDKIDRLAEAVHARP